MPLYNKPLGLVQPSAADEIFGLKSIRFAGSPPPSTPEIGTLEPQVNSISRVALICAENATRTALSSRAPSTGFMSRFLKSFGL